jgi:hypothetical protein
MSAHTMCIVDIHSLWHFGSYIFDLLIPVVASMSTTTFFHVDIAESITTFDMFLPLLHEDSTIHSASLWDI